MSLTLPNGIVTIEHSAFASCRKLANIVIPRSVRSIDTNAFNHCGNLTSIVFSGTVNQWNAITFGDNWDNRTGEYVVYCTNGEITKQ